MDIFCSILVHVRSLPQKGRAHSTWRLVCGCFVQMETIRDRNWTRPRLKIRQKWSVMYNELNF